MGYRDSDDSSFSRHGMGQDHNESRYSEQRAHRGSLEHDEPRGGAYGMEFDDRSDRSGSYGPYPQYGTARSGNDYRADGGFTSRSERARMAPPHGPHPLWRRLPQRWTRNAYVASSAF